MQKLMSVLAVGLLSAHGWLWAAPQEGPSPQWKKVYEAMDKQLPQTTIQELEPIIARALEAGKYAEATKAVALKITMQGMIEGQKPEERITRLQAVLTELPVQMRPTLQTILAHWYWEFFQQNRWRFLQRTQTDQPPGEDLLAWDLHRILAEIDRHFTAALQDEQTLQQVPIAQFAELLVPGTMPDATRPTLFDFLVQEALTFYTAAEQAGAQAQDAFVLQADSPIFAPTDAFLAWELPVSDADSPTLKALHWFQKLLAFHRHDDDPTALAEVDFQRLVFGDAAAAGETKQARYKEALDRFVQQWGDWPISARAREAWARVLQSENRMVEARAVALAGREQHPNTPGGDLCANLIREIEAKELQVSTERVWNNPWPSLHVHYRNLTRVCFRAVRYDWEQLLAQEDYAPGVIPQQVQNEVLQRRPDLTWSHDLPATDDYLAAIASFTVPARLAPGFYVLLASAQEDIREQDNVVLASECWVSPLAVVLRSNDQAGGTTGFVLDADTGAPVPGAEVRTWTHNRVVRRHAWRPDATVRTDQDGLFRITSEMNEPYILLARHGAHQLATASARYAFPRPSDLQPSQRTVFFTDRSLYRPGQTIRFKGICVAIDAERDNYRTLARQAVTVLFEDVNGQEIARQSLRTNDFGSCEGSFTAPRDRLMGQMRIRDAQRGGSLATVAVEEYKRPKFRVELASPTEPAQLNAEVQVPGAATAYTGAAIGAARVTYRVVREVRYPIWWLWRCWWNPPQSAAQEIAHGTTTTGHDGTFTVAFVARPAPDALEQDEPIFQFTVHADVTDITGETRSTQRSVSVGFTTLQASLTADAWQTADQPIAVTIQTQSLDGAPQATQGKVTVYRLQQPDRVHRAPLLTPEPVFRRGRLAEIARGTASPPDDLSNMNAWPLGAAVVQREFATDASGSVTESFPLPAGAYRAVLEAQDARGKPVTALLPVTVLDPNAERCEIKVPHLLAAPRWSAEPGQTFTAFWGTGYEEGRAYVEVEHRGKLIQRYWTRPQLNQATIEQSVTEAMRGGFTVHVTFVRENRAYLESRRVDVPWSNKELQVRWARFVSKLRPGAAETWSLEITGPRAEKAAAEMVATLYDASLDAFLPHQWPDLRLFRSDYSQRQAEFENRGIQLAGIRGQFPQHFQSVTITYRTFPPDIVGQRWGGPVFYGRGGARAGLLRGLRSMAAEAMDGAPMAAPMLAEGEGAAKAAAADLAMPGAGAAPQEAFPPTVDLSKVAARQNLQETAFFFPQLTSGPTGEITLKFTMPEALTEWRFMGFAHDPQLRSGTLTATAVTAKDLMVEPLAPRFVREGDMLEFTVKVSNQSAARQAGHVRLTLANARTLEAVDAQLGNHQTDQTFDIPSKQSQSFSWRLQVPDGMECLTYKAVGATDRLSDGEEGFLPVLSRRILVTESLPLPIRGAATKQFRFERLLASGGSDSLRQQSLTLQMVSQPAWYAVMALPYLMEYPYECTEQNFNRLYANALARHIAQADPKIRRIFDQWRDTQALDSPLEQNADLRSVLLEETPWVRQSRTESEARRGVGILFDANRLDDELARGLRKLVDAQEADGSWPWFPGGPPNDFITLYITTGFGRLRHLGVEIDVAAAVRSLTRLDTWMDEQYRQIVAHGQQQQNHLSPLVALYLYGRSFFLRDQPIAPEHQEANAYFRGQARQHWTKLGNRQSEAHLALALQRFGDRQTPADILRSLKERSVSNEELGMFWRDTERSWWWYRAPIETQAMMIEAFDEVANDAESVEACRVWLLKQKQTQDWKTTKATADAVYSLLLRGTNLLASDALVRVKLDDVLVEPQRVEAGTGFYERRWVRDEVRPALGRIEVTKPDAGVSWGSLHWQYLEDMSKVTPYEGTPLTLRKRLYVKDNTPQGPLLRGVDGPVSVGDELVVRVELRVDRDMEYVHLKDQRGSGVEPVNVLSRYRYQDGLAYYESTRDTASHFFIDYLPKGTYVFEYSTRVVHRGQYQSGMAEIQCLYAPEFNSHSESLLLQVH